MGASTDSLTSTRRIQATPNSFKREVNTDKNFIHLSVSGCHVEKKRMYLTRD